MRPRVEPYGKAVYLSPPQVKKLLNSIDQASPLGARDYALILGYILTARRNSELRKLRYGDISHTADAVWYTWSGKGRKNQRYELPEPVWQAIKHYLTLSARLASIRPQEYIFAPRGALGTSPLSSMEVGRRLKLYAAKSGLEEAKIHVHTLRHTGAMLRKQAGEDVVEIQDDLGHSSLAVTSIYVKKIAGHRDSASDRVLSLIS